MIEPSIGGNNFNYPKSRSSKTTSTGRLLTEEQLSRLLDRLPPPTSVREDTTPLQAGYLLGIQAVISLLREGV